MNTYIYLREVRFHANHGVMPQERTVGADFTVDLRVAYPFEAAMHSDDVVDTLNYARLYDIVKREMAQPSQLLEHVAGRIGKAVFEAFPKTGSLELRITKQNPPMGADCKGVGVEIHLINDKTF